MNETVKKLLKERAIFIVMIAIAVFFAFASDKFMTWNNIINISRQVAILGIASVGMTYVILLGGIDLSTGSIITFINIVCAYFMVKLGLNMWIAILFSLGIATLIGFLNGSIIANLRVPPLIVTFATQTIFAGLAYIICGGVPISRGIPEAFSFIGQGYIGPIPVPVALMIVIFAVGIFILDRTYFGRYFYAVGGNEEAAELSGINVKKVNYLVYALSGLFAGIAGIVLLSRVNSGQPTAGFGYEFKVITAVVLGGVSVNGGSGRLSNVIAGVLIIGILNNGMVLLNISQYVQNVVTGIILLVAMGFDCMQQARLKKK